MIQRIQTIYLVLVFILSVSLFFLPLASVYMSPQDLYDSVSSKLVLRIFTIEKHGTEGHGVVKNLYWLATTNSIIGILVLITIFKYKNRRTQVKLSNFSFLLVLLVLVLGFYQADQMNIIAGSAGKINYLPAALILPVQLILLWMTGRAIRKDENLVRSADRLR